MFSAEFYASLPTKHVAAGCVFLDEVGRVLLVKPIYKEPWELPGGGVEAGESPYDACRREVAEELGLHVSPERLLGVDYRRAVDGVRGDALRFVFLGGVLSPRDTSQIRLNPEELTEWRFVEHEELDGSSSQPWHVGSAPSWPFQRSRTSRKASCRTRTIGPPLILDRAERVPDRWLCSGLDGGEVRDCGASHVRVSRSAWVSSRSPNGWNPMVRQ